MQAQGAQAAGAFRFGDTGSVVVEIALIFPIFVALVIGGFEIWRAVDQSSRLSSAANAGAQYAVQSGKTDASVSGKVTSAYPGSKADFTVSTNAYSQCVGGTAPAGGVCADGFKPIQYVEITVTDTFRPMFQFTPIGQLILTRRAVAAVQ